MKKAMTNFFLHSTKGKHALTEINALARFGHFGEAASVARNILDQNPETMTRMPEITSYERKLLVGSFLGNKERAEVAGQEIPGYSKPS